jgi:hypothetical protein
MGHDIADVADSEVRDRDTQIWAAHTLKRGVELSSRGRRGMVDNRDTVGGEKVADGAIVRIATAKRRREESDC